MKPKIIKKICKKHGNTEYVLEGRGYYRCRLCRQAAVIKRRHRLKELAVKYKGGKCEKCGYNKCIAALEFHHLNPNEKDFNIGHDGYTASFKKIKVELDKCIILCANCHREEHYL